MKLLDIRVLGDPILRQETSPLGEITGGVRELIADMFTTMYAAEGIGLAAPQVGRTERVCVVDVDGMKYALANPEIVERSGSAKAEEGCLSIPDIYGDVERPENVVVRAIAVAFPQPMPESEFELVANKADDVIEIEASGLLARCLQHEIDHLHGKLFIDYFGLFKRRSALGEWDKLKDRYPGFIRRVTPGAPKPRPSSARHATTHTPEQTGEI